MKPTYFHNEQEETMSQGALRALQEERFHAIIRHVFNNNPVQRARFEAAGVSPDGVTLNDIQHIPTMSKKNLRDNYPMGLSCVPREKIVEMHMSSGSTGTPVVMPYTSNDLAQWAECMARCLRMAGARPTDAIQITPSFGLFNGGFGFYHGANAAGLFVIPTGAGNTARQIRLAKDFGTRVLTGVVSYGVRIMEVVEELGDSLPQLEIGIFGAEVFSEGLKKKISKGLNIAAYDIYGMTETGGVGTLGMDCPAQAGIHVWEDHYYVEILDPKTNLPVPEGGFGELAITSLTREALPVIRFKTGDLTRIVSRERCACGRTHLRIAPITGRTDDMLIVKGVNFWPRQVEQALMQIPGVGSNYQIIIEETDGIKDIRVNVEASAGVTGFTVEKHLKEALGFSPQGDVFPIGGLPRQEGKAKRIFHRGPDGELR
jgi:phenylacetate-CoA ligase